MGVEGAPGPAIPLARWADRRLQDLAGLTGSPAMVALTGAGLLSERAGSRGLRVPGMVSAGGGSRLLAARDGHVALSLPREDDRALLPALFQETVGDDAAIARAVARSNAAELVARGRELGLALASANEAPSSPPVDVLARGSRREREPGEKPLVLDLSAIWAGPLAGHLLWLAGAEVVKIESADRPDAMRGGDPALFALLNQGKASVTLDLRAPKGKAALLALIARADMVIEAARPRALLQLGIDAEAAVARHPGLVWLTITGHGASGEAANWIGLGDDCGVAGGLARALAEASGKPGYVGDAIADPLTGMVAALEGWRAWRSGEAQRIGLAMSAIAAQALADERDRDAERLTEDLRGWAAATGRSFPHPPAREIGVEVRPLGADNAAWLC